jgi:hypothetical protein
MSVQVIARQPGETETTIAVGSGASLADTFAAVSPAMSGSISSVQADRVARIVHYFTTWNVAATDRRPGSLELQRQFMTLASRWRDETGMWSSFTRKAAHPYYLRIIAMGKQVVPLILRELRDHGGHWYYALEAITEENPVPPGVSGQVPQMKAAWLQWGRSRGLI